MNSQFKKGIIEMCVLSLVYKRDFYGYELIETISKRVNISEGTVYPILRRLTLENFFETYLKESTEGPPRKYYRMTKKGREETNRLLKQWKGFVVAVNSIIDFEVKK